VPSLTLSRPAARDRTPDEICPLTRAIGLRSGP